MIWEYVLTAINNGKGLDSLHRLLWATTPSKSMGRRQEDMPKPKAYPMLLKRKKAMMQWKTYCNFLANIKTSLICYVRLQ